MVYSLQQYISNCTALAIVFKQKQMFIKKQLNRRNKAIALLLFKQFKERLDLPKAEKWEKARRERKLQQNKKLNNEAPLIKNRFMVTHGKNMRSSYNWAEEYD